MTSADRTPPFDRHAWITMLDTRDSPITAINAVYHDVEHRSQLVVPVIPSPA
jgi:hypothetical protein